MCHLTKQAIDDTIAELDTLSEDSYSGITLLFRPQICRTQVCTIHYHVQCINVLIDMISDKPADKDEGAEATADGS